MYVCMAYTSMHIAVIVGVTPGGKCLECVSKGVDPTVLTGREANGRRSYGFQHWVWMGPGSIVGACFLFLQSRIDSLVSACPGIFSLCCHRWQKRMLSS